MKIALYCFGTYPHFFKELVKAETGIDWLAIVPTYHFKEEMENLLGKENVFYVQEHLNQEVKRKQDISSLKDYAGSIFKDVVSDKSPISRMPKEYQLRNISSHYSIYKRFLAKTRPDAVFFPSIETYDQLVLHRLCMELGIEPVISVHARNLGSSFFSDSPNETLPSYATSEGDPTARKKALEFIKAFRKDFKPPNSISSSSGVSGTVAWKRPPFWTRSARYISSILSNREPNYITENTPLQKIKVNLLPFLRLWRRAKWNLFSSGHFELKSADTAPSKFIYYPLQYTPESSINSLAPFFIDQLRAIDMVLFNMPSDHLLVVKEHPAMKGIRPSRFYVELKKKAGVVLAHPDVSSQQLTRSASLTVSVTGTACLEAFLFGKPSLQLGRSFFTEWISHGDSVEMRDRVKSAMGAKISDEKIAAALTRLFSVSFDFVLSDPSSYSDPDIIMNRNNIRLFAEALKTHLARVLADKQSK